MTILKNFLKNKGVGFYIFIGAFFLSIINLIVYSVFYSSTRFLSLPAIIFIILGAISVIALTFFKQLKWAAPTLALCSFLALLFFIYGIYFYVSVVLVGIQIKEFSPEFIVCSTLFILTFALSAASIFLTIEKSQTQALAAEALQNT